MNKICWLFRHCQWFFFFCFSSMLSMIKCFFLSLIYFKCVSKMKEWYTYECYDFAPIFYYRKKLLVVFLFKMFLICMLSVSCNRTDLIIITIYTVALQHYYSEQVWLLVWKCMWNNVIKKGFYGTCPGKKKT